MVAPYGLQGWRPGGAVLHRRAAMGALKSHFGKLREGVAGEVGESKSNCFKA
jgi:hypothetical protein